MAAVCPETRTHRPALQLANQRAVTSRYGGANGGLDEDGRPEVPEDPNEGKTPEEIAAEVNCMAHGIC